MHIFILWSLFFYIQHIKSTVRVFFFFTSTNKFRLSLHWSLVKQGDAYGSFDALTFVDLYFVSFIIITACPSLFPPFLPWKWIHLLFLPCLVLRAVVGIELTAMAFTLAHLYCRRWHFRHLPCCRLLFEVRINAEGAARAHLCIYIFRLSC